MRAFVTGGQGFVGPWLIRHLESCGDEVAAPGPEVDITVPEAIGAALAAARPDAVYHLAAQSSVGSSWTEVGQTFAVNTLGTVNVLEAARACAEPAPGAARQLFGGLRRGRARGAAGGRGPPRSAPSTPYAASKAAAELPGIQAWLGRGWRSSGSARSTTPAPASSRRS